MAEFMPFGFETDEAKLRRQGQMPPQTPMPIRTTSSYASPDPVNVNMAQTMATPNPVFQQGMNANVKAPTLQFDVEQQKRQRQNFERLQELALAQRNDQDTNIAQMRQQRKFKPF